MTSDALTDGGKCVMLNAACTCSQGYTYDSVFWLVQMMLCIMTLSKFPPFVTQIVI